MYEATYFNGLQERQMKSIKEIYRIGRGPSSSHTMGPESAAKMFINEFPSAGRYEAVLYGSLAQTGKGHGTDRVLRETFAPRVLRLIDRAAEEEGMTRSGFLAAAAKAYVRNQANA